MKNIYIIIVIFIILFFGLYCYNLSYSNTKEHFIFVNPNIAKPLPSTNVQTKDQPADISEKRIIDILEGKDSVFLDLITYNNLESEDDNGIIHVNTGLDQCYDKCNGTCLEYGETGIAFCFPPSPTQENKYIDNPVKPNQDNMSYPNIDRKKN